MSFLGRLLTSVNSFNPIAKCLSTLKEKSLVEPSSLLHVAKSVQTTQIRGRYIDWKMLRDVKRRRTVVEYGPEKLRIRAVAKNRILPVELKEMAANHMLNVMPRNAHHTRLTRRCVITSRPRGVVHRWRMSRIAWRNLADYNKLSGVTRSWW